MPRNTPSVFIQTGSQACHIGVLAYGLFEVLIRDSSGEGPAEYEHMWSSFLYEVMNMSFITERMMAQKAAWRGRALRTSL